MREPSRMREPLPTPDLLTVYGAAWCSDCHHVQRYLDTAGVAYRYVDLGQDDAAREMLDHAGYRAIPIVVTTDGTVLIEPSGRELAALGAGGEARPGASG